MRELLVTWWAQQLRLLGWPPASDPRQALEPQVALDRLVALGIGDRDEFAWRLWESVTDAQSPAVSRLAALELLGLGACLEWIDEATTAAWLRDLVRDVVTEAPTLKSWLAKLSQLGEPSLDAAGRELARLERQGRGADWQRVAESLRVTPAQETDRWGDTLWHARAPFGPVLAWPFTPTREEQHQRRQLLREEGEVNDREGLLTLLHWLGAQGHRYGWEMDAARLARQRQSETLEWLATLNDQQDYGRVLLRFLADQEPLDWAAWDWLRLVDQAYLGFMAGWLSATEAETFAAHALDLLQQRYADWTAVALAYRRGRSLFEGRDLRATEEVDWERLLGECASPWQVPLADCLDEARRERSRAAIQERHAGPDAWVLALATVREPDLIYRRSLQEPLSQERRQDAERYLEEVLMLRRDEGIEGLARFWLPAQAHHLNQLAADARHAPAKQQARRAGLVACAEHAATIAMAEKYAFYLLMAADSGRYAPEAIRGLSQSLCDVLSRFYATPERLLAAWSAWERLLAEEDAPDEAALTDDIEWHRGDPGSRFHWLGGSQSVAWLEPGARPTLMRFTGIALAGPLNEALWQTPQTLGAVDRASLAEWLESQYALPGAAELAGFLDFLVEAGDRQEYAINYAPYTLNRKRLEAEIAILESGECGDDERVHLCRLQRVRDNACRCNDEDLAAWDVAQLVDLTLAGRQLGWLDDEQLNTYLNAAMDLAGRHYGSWQDYAEGLYSGFGFFMDDTPERDAFLSRFREALNAWLTATPLLAGAWASLDFPAGHGRHWTPLHIDVLPHAAGYLH
ncbi:DUF1266 domain-containing protein [Salinicola avicenniae]|uniref:DUF1266 domain-containing protein n=1 Tax=Salinicola avicenniae TaxID=2916836 RepID=UPI00207470CC|nr:MULTISPECIES: YbeU/YbeR family protein [unclassified Salinicola]